MKIEAIVVRASNGRAVQAPVSVWVAEIIKSMTNQQRDSLFARVENRISPLIVQPAPLNGGKMILKKPLEV